MLAASSNFNLQASALQSSSSSDITASATLVANAPAAKDAQSVYLLFDNDVDSKTPKTPIILLSKLKKYKDSQASCSAMGESLQSLLDLQRIWKQHLLVAGVNIDKSKHTKVKTPNAGTWQGYRDQNQFHFLGIPYAEPPLGNLWFQKPMRFNPKKYGGNNRVNDATEFGHACMQLPFTGENFTPEQEVSLLGAWQSEDCLYLNVFTPALKVKRAKGLPVMVYVHGGNFTSLAGSSLIFEPENVVSRGGVVVVTFNPRSKAPGYLATRDYIATLRWVYDNIVAFGGDPSQAPSAFGLYKNVISQSDLIGIAPNVHQKPENQWVLPAAVYRPTIDKSLIPTDFTDLLKSGKYSKKANVLWGFTKDEGNSFISTTLPTQYLSPYTRTRHSAFPHRLSARDKYVTLTISRYHLALETSYPASSRQATMPASPGKSNPTLPRTLLTLTRQLRTQISHESNGPNTTSRTQSIRYDAGWCEWLSENTKFDYQVNGPGGRFVPIFPPVAIPPTLSTKTSSSTRTKTRYGTTTIQTPSSVSLHVRSSDDSQHLTTQSHITAVTIPSPTGSESAAVSVSASSSGVASESVSGTPSGSASLTTITVVPTTTDAIIVPPTTSAPPPPPTTTVVLGTTVTAATTTRTTVGAPVDSTAP
ncbi:hypothetical protein KI688_001355 [Linnemannia hyalina]|uniref:Carboxylesterase type B domain-containing protein n=1 Tax=Linnemannia hyalina TaxID=64524 RepID=A0A9P7XUS7_9FUNG|nr:hypothetical protein KI688_001355 [Linnemannia hyalina]